MAPPGMGSNPMIAGAIRATQRGERNDFNERTISSTNPADSNIKANVKIRDTVRTSFQVPKLISEW
jgi:hypothetical protein